MKVLCTVRARAVTPGSTAPKPFSSTTGFSGSVTSTSVAPPTAGGALAPVQTSLLYDSTSPVNAGVLNAMGCTPSPTNEPGEAAMNPT